MNERIVVISEDLAAPWDEGIKKFAYSVGSSLGREHDVRILNIDRAGVGQSNGVVSLPGSYTFLSLALRNELRSFAADTIVYVPSPSSTLASFARSFMLRRHAPAAKIGMVALIPRRHGSSMKSFLGAAAPDIVFVPSYGSLLHLQDHGLRGELTPVGIDLSVFRPPGPGERDALRDKYSVGREKFVYLHVGHVSENRNVRQLTALTGDPDIEVILIGSTSTHIDRSVRDAIETGGVRVIREYVAVEEFYRLADCYVFPVVNPEGCVEIPLSVFEALASGLRVVTRPFGGLRDFLEPGHDVVYCESVDELTAAALAARSTTVAETRSMSAFGWDVVARGLIAHLSEVRR